MSPAVVAGPNHIAACRQTSTGSTKAIEEHTAVSGSPTDTQIRSYVSAQQTLTTDANGNCTNSGYSTDDDNRLSSDGTWNYSYDNEGNRLSATKIATGACILYTWDYRNRLTDITYKTSGTGTVTKQVHYTYDVNDLRIGKQVDSDGNGTWDSSERYAYDGQNIVLVFDGSGTILNRYLQTGAMDQALAEETPGQPTRWLLPDHQGTIRDEVDSGTGQTHLTYNSFGQILSTSGSLPAPRFTYTGREWDADAGLFYYRARWYDAANGRFINQDPVGFTAGDGNLYRYVGNGPVNATDLSGLCKEGRSGLSPDQRSLLERTQKTLDKITNGSIGGSSGTQVLAEVQRQLLAGGFDPEAVRNALQPYVEILRVEGLSEMERNRWYTSGERFQGSLSILSNALSFGATNKMGITDTSQYHGSTFTGAYAGASAAQFGEAGLMFGAAGQGFGLMAESGGTLGVVGAAGQGGLVGFGVGMSANQIGNGVSLLSNGDSINGWSQIVQGGGSLGLMGIGITNPDAFGSLSDPFGPRAGIPMGEAAPLMPEGRLSDLMSMNPDTAVTTDVATSWQQQQQFVTDWVQAMHPSETIGTQVTLDVANLNTGETLTIIADNVIPDGGTYQLVDAKFSQVRDLTNPTVNLTSAAKSRKRVRDRIAVSAIPKPASSEPSAVSVVHPPLLPIA